MEIQVAEIGRLYSALIRRPETIWLLGAGASLKSGIPLADGVVEKAAKWAFALAYSRSPDDPRIQRSDWFPWLTANSWYRRDVGPAENYHAVVDQLLSPRQNRWEFFIRLINPGVEPSPGYEKLAEFLHIGFIRTILTTNFDHTLPDVHRKLRRPHVLTLIQTEADYNDISTSPSFPQLIYTHGSVERYTDLNILEEVQRLHPVLVQRLVPLLRDHPVIVIGYRGGERSVMEHLLLENIKEANHFRHGVYWCVLSGDHQLTPLTRQFAEAIGRNFHIVHIDGFDELLVDHLWPLYQRSGSVIPQTDSETCLPDGPFDLRPLDDVDTSDLQFAVLRDRLVRYCQRLEIQVPHQVDQAWIIEQAVRQNLMARINKSVHPTVAGYTLFGPSDQKRIPRRVLLEISGPPEWLAKVLSEETGSADSVSASAPITRTMEGNLWSLLDQIITTLAIFNLPFRLKGDISEEVQPYPPLALKEIVVNALVHRDYQKVESVLIKIEPSLICITNPGGLVDEVRSQLHESSIQDQIVQGKRGIKGYRNPVIADLFYGGGAMDKAGSGLADVHRLVHEAGGRVEFGPSSDNDVFIVTIHCRPEAVDDITKTARPKTTKMTRYAANILEILQLPGTVFHAETQAKTRRDVWLVNGEKNWLPAYVISNQRVYSFHDLNDRCGPLGTVVDPATTESLSLPEFLSLEEGSRWLTWLLNESLYNHLRRRDLYVDRKRKRAYFTRNSDAPRQITYQGRIRKATRTVVKPRFSSTAQKITYWEHKSLGFAFERFGDSRGLTLVPGYVFTWNGTTGLLAPERVNRLSTRRAARDYNVAVQSDLYFWAWLLSEGSSEPYWLEDLPAVFDVKATSRPIMDIPSDNRIFLSPHFPTVAVPEFETEFGTDAVEPFESELAELDDELSSLGEDALEAENQTREDLDGS